MEGWVLFSHVGRELEEGEGEGKGVGPDVEVEGGDAGEEGDDGDWEVGLGRGGEEPIVEGGSPRSVVFVVGQRTFLECG
jgi:hypothetical protein